MNEAAKLSPQQEKKLRRKWAKVLGGIGGSKTSKRKKKTSAENAAKARAVLLAMRSASQP